MATISVYGEDQPRVYPLSRIYDPDIDGTNASASGKIIPEVCSQVVDDTKGLHNQLYTVTAVDPVTYKVTMVPTAIVMTEDGQPDRVLSYGNDIYMLYYATVAITDNTGTVVRLTRLVIDNKLAFFGHHGAQYELIRTNKDGSTTVVSQNFDTMNKPTGTRVPVVETAVPGVRKCVNCYSYASFKDGEQIALRIYDAAGILIAIVQLITKQALILNELTDSSNPIVGFDIVANQMLDGDIILYTHQNKEELALYPQITYADGTTQIVSLDGISGFLYGLEEISTEILGNTFLLTAKYYISDDTPATIAKGEGTRYLVCDKTVRIVESTKYTLSKISVIPVWQSNLNNWKLELFGYKDNRKGFSILSKVATVKTITDKKTPSGDPIYGEFVPNAFDTRQDLLINVLQTPDSGVEEPYSQTVSIELRDPNKSYPWFLLKDDYNQTSEPTYGDNTPPHIAPVIYYGPVTSTDGTVVNTYRIPNELFKETLSQTATEVFLENFYFNSRPPKIKQESGPAIPTHFTVRAPVSGIAILTQPRKVENFADPLFLNANLDQYVNSTLVVEFWKQIDDTSFELLYGVPVMVIAHP